MVFSVVCDETCRETVLDSDGLLVCTVSGHCFDRLVSFSVEETNVVSRMDFLLNLYSYCSFQFLDVFIVEKHMDLTYTTLCDTVMDFFYLACFPQNFLLFIYYIFFRCIYSEFWRASKLSWSWTTMKNMFFKLIVIQCLNRNLWFLNPFDS